MPHEETSTLRSALRVGAVWLPTVSVGLTWFVLRDDLPATLVTQWSGRVASGHTPTLLVFAVTAGIAAGAAACAGRSERRRVWNAVGFSSLSASAWLVLALVNLQPAPDMGGWGLLTPLAFLYGGLPAALTRPVPPPTTEEAQELEAAEEAEAPDIARDWVISPVSVALASLAGTAAVISAAATQQIAVAIVLAVIALVSAEFAVIRIRRTATRLLVLGAVPWLPLYAIRVEQIGSIERVDIRPFDWGGWGYRFGRSGTGVILRTGPGVTIRSSSRTAFTVNVRHPERFTTPHRPAMNASSPS